MSRFHRLDDWLDWQQQLHVKEIDLGLQRVSAVAAKLNLILLSDDRINLDSPNYSGVFNSHISKTNASKANASKTKAKVVSVAGTNGKGSCIKTIEQGLLIQHSANSKLLNSQPFNSQQFNSQQGLVGSYTSPHIEHYCERICIDGQPVSESLICDAFAAIDKAREEIPLTYFEFGTLAALWIFQQKKIPYVLLEVGLGGRLDAVNIVDADIAVITSIGIDHEEWLGSDRNIISKEKLGIAREKRPLVIGEKNLTHYLKQAMLDYPAFVIDRDYQCVVEGNDHWHFQWFEDQSSQESLTLVKPPLYLETVATGLMALKLLDCLPSSEQLQELMLHLQLPGRFESMQVNGIQVIFDVAHNPAAAKILSGKLASSQKAGEQTLAVMAMMSDKDHINVLNELQPYIDHWYIGELSDIPRAATNEELQTIFESVSTANKIYPFSVAETIEAAFAAALSKLCGFCESNGDTEQNGRGRILVFGSFYTVAAIKQFIANQFS
jgi:dihydrofolate synthase/folylpolyglutamate synthase